MSREKLLKLGPYAAFLQRRWRLGAARTAGSLRNVFSRDYREKKIPLHKIMRLHSKGWGVDDWAMCGGGMNAEKAENYLSTVDYKRMHPFNGSYSSWIDDKLTLMYLCQAPELKSLMPDYYYHVMDGAVLPLPDCPDDLRDCGACGVLSCLERYGELAIKQIKGSLGKGFYKAEMRNGEIMVNGSVMPRDKFMSFISSSEGYIVTEYLHPHQEMSKFSKNTANTIRYLVANVNGAPLFLTSFIRFGTKASGLVENYNSGGVLCYLDEEGCYGGGNVIDFESRRNTKIETHPDTGAPLVGRVPLWDEMQTAARVFIKHFPQLVYLGFDFVASDKGVKMLEINSLSSLDVLQLDQSAFDLPNGEWFRKRLAKVKQGAL
jgi:hypothetical protein